MFRSLTGILALAIVVAASDARAQAIKGWGEPLDREKDCQIGLQGEVMVIGVPGKPHELKPAPGKRNAPRVWRYNEGNFAATVKVSGDLALAGEATGAERSAGFVLWQDDRNFVRLARASIEPGKESLVFEYWKDGQLQAPPSGVEAARIEGPTTWLRLSRRASNLKIESSADGENWAEAGSLPIRLSSRLQLGVHATNTSTRPLEARFEGLSIKPIPLYAQP